MMNATSLYVSMCKLVIQANPDDPGCLTDLCRLMPYLRQSLSCTVCGNLLIEPYTPTETNCQHHVCKTCKFGKKKLKPTCSWCKNYSKYFENVQLRILLQCYKKLCEYVMSSPLYRLMSACSGEGNITDLIDEGAGFKDEYKCNAGLSKSAYSILPCVYTHTSTQTSANNLQNTSLSDSLRESDDSLVKQNGSSMYSVMYAGSGNKMVIKRNVEEDGASRITLIKAPSLKRPMHRRTGKTRQGRQGRDDCRRSGKGAEKKQRFGCRCGNATVTPGKLTCCGQRCPCYVVSKACLDCKCRGCRNPHTKEGQKILRDVLDLKSEPSDDALDTEMLHVDRMPSEMTDIIQTLLTVPYKLNSIQVRQQIIEKGRPIPALKSKGDATKNSEPKFNPSWYELHRWLCGSVQLNKLFCWPCLLMRPESSSWSSTGVDDIKRISALATKHSSCKAHLKAIVEFDAALIEFGEVPVFNNEQTAKAVDLGSDSDSDYLGKYLAPKRPTAPLKEDKSSHKFSQPTTLTFRAWQQANRSHLETNDPKLQRRRRRLAEIKIKNAELEGEKIRLEIQLLQAKLKYQQSINQETQLETKTEEATQTSGET